MEEAHFARTIAWLLRTQALLAGGAGAVFAVIGGPGPAIAAVSGGLLGVMLTAIAALRIGAGTMAEHSGVDGQAEDPDRVQATLEVMIRNFYRAMAMKLILAVVLFVIVAKWFPGYFAPVVTGYAATVVAYWLALWRLKAPGV